jgi:diketogulonate reductase-like aldo/keto reductase
MITFGTMNIKKRDSIAIVTQALHMGVTSVDTAPTYGNESEVGAAIMEQFSHVKVTIKVPKRATSPEEARKEVVQSLSLLRRSQVDIILLHWPCDFIESDTLSTVWKELEKMKEEGLCLAIGVCNFTTKALMTLLEHCTIKPSLNQVERHPLLPQYDLLEYCDSHGIIVQSHTALGNGHALLLGNDTISRVARECLMSPAQGENETSLALHCHYRNVFPNVVPSPKIINLEQCYCVGICNKIPQWSSNLALENMGRN